MSLMYTIAEICFVIIMLVTTGFIAYKDGYYEGMKSFCGEKKVIKNSLTKQIKCDEGELESQRYHYYDYDNITNSLAVETWQQ